MNVADLIRELHKLPQDMPVVIEQSGLPLSPIAGVDQISVRKIASDAPGRRPAFDEDYSENGSASQAVLIHTMENFEEIRDACQREDRWRRLSPQERIDDVVSVLLEDNGSSATSDELNGHIYALVNEGATRQQLMERLASKRAVQKRVLARFDDLFKITQEKFWS